jgi:nitrogen fixation/metabolism regulation signal transduction histidine kinase
MIWYIERINRDFNAFLLGLLQADFTATFNEQSKGKSFAHLYSTFNKINRKFRSISTEKEIQHLYLETMIEHVKTGIISFDPDGKVHLINDAFKGLLNKPFLQNIHGLESINMQLVDTLKDIKPNQKELLKISIKGNLLHLSIHATAFKLHDTEYKLVSFQDIKNELDAQELDAWQKLIRVLTHEIMNSVTPITSLTATLYDMVKSDLKNKDTLDISTMNNLMEGLNVILNRSNGLHRFTEAYRNLSRIPTPNFQQINIAENVRQVITLQEHNFKKVKINFKSEKDDLNINADPELLQQVLINLIKNAAEALEKVESPVIDISISRKNNECLIMVNDNGHGIPVDVLDKIFIPFYTTKKDGSGIGLPLCKQIIQLHGGKLSVRTAIQDGTTFTISL